MRVGRVYNVPHHKVRPRYAIPRSFSGLCYEQEFFECQTPAHRPPPATLSPSVLLDGQGRRRLPPAVLSERFPVSFTHGH